MNLEPMPYEHEDRWYFDVVDMDDVTGDLPELIWSDGRPFKREETALRNAKRWIKARCKDERADTSDGDNDSTGL